MKKNIVTIVGARPQFVKAAPVSRALSQDFNEILIHTGQHYDYGMSEIFFQEMQMRPADFNLGVGGGSHGEQTGMMLMELEKKLADVHADCVLVYGDTNSTLAGALAAAKAGIPLAHVEAGLRSYNRAMPEEINRVLTDHVSTFLFCPTDVAIENLTKEGITRGVFQVGDVMYDALLHNLTLARSRSQIVSQLELKAGGYALATIHRAANTDNPERLLSLLDALSSLPTRVVFPVHPRTRGLIARLGWKPSANILLIEPLGYFDILTMQENANCILTDSGGMQKEAYLLGVRCITLREETEWVETVSSGWNKLVGVDKSAILDAFTSWHPSGNQPALYGDGHSAEKIREVLVEKLG